MFSDPAVNEKFFGRKDILEVLNKRTLALKDGYRQNIALTGQSLSGKTSIILHFLHIMQEEGFIPIYVEVIKEDFTYFSKKFIATMLYSALKKNLPDYTIPDFDHLLKNAATMLPKTYNAIKVINNSIESKDFDKAYISLLELTSIVKLETGLPCIVILDEFDNLEHIGIKNPFSNFGKIIMVQKDTMYIVSSSRNLAIRKIISEKLSLLFGNFEIVKVANFDVESANKFLDLKLGGFEIDDFTRKFIISFTDGNPFYINKIVVKIKDIAINNMSSFIDREIIVSAILELVYNSSGTIHQYLMNYVLELLESKSKDLNMAVLIAMAEGCNKQSDISKKIKIKQADTISALQRLSELGIISKNGSFYMIEDTMLKFWLKYVYNRKKNMLIGGAIDKIELFRNDLIEYIKAVESEFSFTSIERVSELFNRFSNDLVQIDGKNMRLPHFTAVEVKINDSGLPMLKTSFRSNVWAIQVFDNSIHENDIVNFIRTSKELNCKISTKLIISLLDIDENAKLLAKELKISIWDNQTINMLLGLYNKKRLVVL